MEIRTDYRLNDADGLTARFIRAAVLAGAYREAIRLDPYLARGFGPLADRHSSAAKKLSDEFCSGAGLMAQASGLMPNRRVR